MTQTTTAPALARPIRAAHPGLDPVLVSRVAPRIAGILESGRFVLGPYTERVEALWAETVGTRHAVMLSSCTAALEIALRYVGIQGRPVLLPANTFAATAAAIAYAGGRPVPIDITPDTYGANLAQMADAIDRLRPAAVVLVHIAGLVDPCAVDFIHYCCKQFQVPLIEDCAHAHGATVAGRPAGSLGLAGCWSFYPTKILTTGGTGGAITTDDADLAAFARSMRHHGAGDSLATIELPGNDWLMSEIEALVLAEQIPWLRRTLEFRRQVEHWYKEALAEVPVLPPPYLPGVEPARYKLPLLVRDRETRDRILAAFAAARIEGGTLYDPPVYRQPGLRHLFEPDVRCPVAEDVLGRQICPPFHAEMTRDQVETVAAVIRETTEVRNEITMMDCCRRGHR